MRQILQNLKDGKISLADIPVPSVKAGHVLIKTTKSLISIGTERMLLNFGRAGWVDKARQQPDKVKQVISKIKTDGLAATAETVLNKLDQPLPLGYCNAGVVIEVGKGVHEFKPGDRVISNGNHAEVVCIPRHLCAKIPDSVDDISASFTVLSAIALQGVRLVDPTLGERIAVMGLGLIGIITGQILKANGCQVIGFDLDPEKVKLAKSYGIRAFIPGKTDPVDAAMDFSDGNGVDGVIITAATKSNDPIKQAPQMCRKRGRVVLVGVIGLEMSRDDFYKKEISFQVSCSYGPGRYDPGYEKNGLDFPIGFVRWTEERNFKAILDLMADKRLAVKELVSAVIPFNSAIEAYDRVEKDAKALGLVLDYPGNVDLKRKNVEIREAETGNVHVSSASEPVIGFIGAGGFAASTLVPAFVETGAKLKTIASSTGVSGTHLGKKHGFFVSTTDYKYILSDEEINTVVITTQHDSHAKFVIEALKANKNVFVEKPLCLTREELTEISRLYKESAEKGRILMVGFNRRFSPLSIKAKELISELPGAANITMTVNAGKIPADHWTQSDETGGGRIIGEACHFIDLVRFFAGSPIAEVVSLSGNGASEESPPDSSVIAIKFQNGSIGSVQYFPNGSKDFPKERIEIFKNGKILQIDNFKSLIGYGFPNFSSEKLWAQDKGHKNEAMQFIEAIRLGKPCPIPFSETVEVTGATMKVAG
ncbi:MAG: bi-domain-containing oxidoreductase [Candidatus Riflebacteria bacterium]|nr:bi-domain-containing oxidoreductase [Candidatus Riflebacteria bacterium]